MTDIRKTEYRKVTPEEKLYIDRLQGMAFSVKLDESEIRAKIKKGEYNCDNTYGAIDESGRVLAGMEVIPYSMWFDGQKVSMYGIGGVASVPEARRQGNIRGIFEKAFADIYEKGAVFSHLYPFSYDYYRKFGYEHCGAAKKYTLPIAPARKLKNSGTAHEFIKGDNVREKLIDVFELYASRHNIMISRSKERWDEVFDIPLFDNGRLYYWKDAEQNIKSWVKFAKNDDDIQVSDIVWADHESVLGILQLLGMFEGAAKKLVFTSSPEFIPELYWNNLYDIKTENIWLGMNRIVNVKQALKLMKKPKGNGQFIIKVVDRFAKWNSNTYKVEYSGGECMVNILSPSADADIEVSECALVQMILGTYGLRQIALREDVKINGDLHILEKVFCKKGLLITDYF